MGHGPTGPVEVTGCDLFSFQDGRIAVRTVSQAAVVLSQTLTP